MATPPLVQAVLLAISSAHHNMGTTKVELISMIRVSVRAPNEEVLVNDAGCCRKSEGSLASGQRNARNKVKDETRNVLFCLVEWGRVPPHRDNERLDRNVQNRWPVDLQ